MPAKLGTTDGMAKNDGELGEMGRGGYLLMTGGFLVRWAFTNGKVAG